MSKPRSLLVVGCEPIAMLLLEQISSSLGLSVTFVDTIAEGNLHLQSDSYGFAVINIVEEEHMYRDLLSLASKSNTSVIALTATFSTSMQSYLASKGVIGLIDLDSPSALLFVRQCIETSIANVGKKVIVLTDSEKTDPLVQSISVRNFNLIKSAHTDGVLACLDKNPDVKLLVIMFDGDINKKIKLVRSVRNSYSKEVLSIIAVLENQNYSSLITNLIVCGIDDIVKPPVLDFEFGYKVQHAVMMTEHIENAKNAAFIDYLTGVHNRRYFFENIDKYLKLSRANEMDSALVVFDIDHFKKINDKYGHDAGDRALIAFSRLLRDSFPDPSLVSRFGGEEFVLCFRGSSIDSMKACLERFRAYTADLTIDNAGTIFSFTVSGGAIFNPRGDIDSALSITDNLLYLSKKEGRNRISY